MARTPDHPRACVVDTEHSSHAELKPVPLTAVTLTDSFWAPRLAVNREVTLPAQYQQLESTGRLDNFRRAAGRLDIGFQGRYYNDSDVYKWLEAAAWSLAATDDPALEQLLEGTVDLIVEAQEPDGYLNTYFTFDRASERWSNLRDMHELYCAGHLFHATIAHYRTTGNTRLLDAARRFADLICDTFGPGEAQRPGVAGHPEIEMALVELSRATGELRYLEQAAYFVDARGHGLLGSSAYHQDHQPLRETDRLTGHAVRAAYLVSGAADVLAETGEPALGEALTRLWLHMQSRQTYVTGGLGSRHRGEAIGADYELPNALAYAETCAGIANVMWAWRMLQLHGDAGYADLMERALYNAVLPGISLAGTTYFYVNPLANDGQAEPGGEIYRRQPWFGTACCPTNISRTLAAFPGMLYGVTGGTVWVHHYAANEAQLTLPDGTQLQIVQRTRYPWNGLVTIEVLTEATFTLNVRIPGWCNTQEERFRPTISVNNTPYAAEVQPGHYATIERTWSVGDAVCIQMPMAVRQITAHPHILENTGRTALFRGPLLYCLEGVDHPQYDLRDIILPPDGALTSSFRADRLGGVQVIEGTASVVAIDAAWTASPYQAAAPPEGALSALELTAIPYFAWANREPGALQIWLRSP